MTLRLGTAGKPGKGATAFNKPTDVAVHRQSNEVYVADGYGNSRVAVFTYDGLFVSGPSRPVCARCTLHTRCLLAL